VPTGVRAGAFGFVQREPTTSQEEGPPYACGPCARWADGCTLLRKADVLQRPFRYEATVVQPRHPKLQPLGTPDSGSTSRAAAGMPNRGAAPVGRPVNAPLGRRYPPAGQYAPRRAPTLTRTDYPTAPRYSSIPGGRTGFGLPSLRRNVCPHFYITGCRGAIPIQAPHLLKALIRQDQNISRCQLRGGVHLEQGYVNDVCLTPRFNQCVFYEDELTKD